MPNWKKLLTSGSNIQISALTLQAAGVHKASIDTSGNIAAEGYISSSALLSGTSLDIKLEGVTKATIDTSGNITATTFIGNVDAVDGDFDGTLEVDNLTIGGAQGSDGQVLTSTGNGVAWEDAAGGSISGNTFATDLKIGRDADNLIDFTTDNQVTFRVSAGDGIVMKASGEIEATKFDGDLEGNVDTATLAATVTIVDNEDTNENNPIVFVPGGDLDGGNFALESDGTTHYNPSTGKITATLFAGTVSTATQGTINHDSLANFDNNKHIDHSAVSVTAGTGLTGGGTIAADRTLNVIGGDGITANADNIAITADQTTITSIYATDLIIGEDAETAIDFGTPNEIDFKINNATELTLTATALHPVSDAGLDLGTTNLEFKDAFFDGTVTSDAFAGPLTGKADTADALHTARAINGEDFDGSAAITVTAAAVTLSGNTLKSTVVASSLTSVGTIANGVWNGDALTTDYIANDAITEDKLADTLLAEIDANTGKNTNVVGNLGVLPAIGSLTVTTTNGNNVLLPAATTTNWGVMTDEMFDAIAANTAKETNEETTDASAGTKGKVALASNAEAIEGTDTAKVITPRSGTAMAAAVTVSKKVHELTAPTAALVMNSQKITGVTDPTAAQDAATKAYVDSYRLEALSYALSDETSDIASATSVLTARIPYAFTVTNIRANVNTVSSSGLITVDINIAGSTVLSTKLTIDASEFTSATAADAHVVSDTTWADDAEIVFDIDGHGTGAKGLKVTIIGYQS